MRATAFLLAALAAGAATLAALPHASACGGCFTSTGNESRGTQVTGHRMVLSISNDATTLWDQIEYVGAPEEFAWVLPIRGQVDVGLSSDALFRELERLTAISITSPEYTCNFGSSGAGYYDPCGGFGSADSATTTGSGGGEDFGQDKEPPVQVIAQETVGPYETVQLSSDDPLALYAWLDSHAYAIPEDVKPILDAYVAEGFDFLALKLVPGAGVDAMRPVRITTPGGAAELPLRMVAAGTGATTSMNLWVLGEGRYETANFPSFTIASSELTWDFDVSSSDYKQVREAGFAASDGTSWLVEAAEPMGSFAVEEGLLALAESDPVASGYADENGEGAVESATADLTALFGTIDTTSLWVTRLHGELSRAALATDLALGAAPEDGSVVRDFYLTKSVGTPPCPQFDCHEGDGGGGADGLSSNDASSDASCAIGHGDGVPALAGALGLVAALGIARRRR